MGRVVFVIVAIAGSIAGLVLLAGPGQASLYSPDEPMANPVGADGKAESLPFDEFKRRLGVLLNAMDAQKNLPDRQKFLKRIAERSAAKKLPTDEVVALATDLHRVGQDDKALDLLSPKIRERPPDYFVFATLAHVHAARGEWGQAIDRQDSALEEAKMPATIKGLSKAQRDWWEKLDREYLPHYYHVSKQEADRHARMTASEREDANKVEEPTPLFPLPDQAGPRSPVRFVNEKGAYQPGVLAPAERAKLPPDALAIVQQLVIWFPTDVRLYWLLAELYVVEGDLHAANTIMQECPWGRKYSRKVLLEHRAAIEAALAAQPRSTPPEDVPLVPPSTNSSTPTPTPGPDPISMRTVWIYFGVVALIGVFALIRALIRRGKGEPGPLG